MIIISFARRYPNIVGELFLRRKTNSKWKNIVKKAVNEPRVSKIFRLIDFIQFINITAESDIAESCGGSAPPASESGHILYWPLFERPFFNRPFFNRPFFNRPYGQKIETDDNITRAISSAVSSQLKF